MYRQEAREEYSRALRQGQKRAKELLLSGKDPNPAVLDELLGGDHTESIQDVGLIEIPAERIVGTKSAGRITAFTAEFQPLLDTDTEFAFKWISLCADHLSDEGIREPITCFEYLGNFYVQEGNKRVSVLRHFDAPKIPGYVRRVLPTMSDEPRIKAYYEFLDFYKVAKLYDVQFENPGDYARLLSFLGKEPGEEWTDRERKTFCAYLQYFREAFTALKGETLGIQSEDALLLWLQVYPFRDLGKFSAGELKKTLEGLWEDVTAMAEQTPVQVQTEPTADSKKTGILARLMTSTPEYLEVAFVHQLDPQSSTWIKGHEEGSQYLQDVMGDKVTVRSYYHGDSQEQTEALLDQAVEDGAEVVFTTSPQMSRATLKAAVKYPKVRFLNCSADAPFSSVRTYYGRVYEGKFITGAIAGAMAENDRIGYIGAYPIFGEIASINAFALGAQMTNPRAKIELRWSCMAGSPVQDFVREGIRVISNRDVPTQNKMYLEFGEYGTYQVGETGTLTPLGSPCWLWGKFYENVVRAVMSGAWAQSKEPNRPVNYWWGMNSGVIDVKMSDNLPEGLLRLANMIRDGILSGYLDPFQRKIIAQDGTVMNDGSRSFSPDELLHMDWLCENVEGMIPEFEEVEPFARNMVRQLGIHRERIPIEKEGAL